MKYALRPEHMNDVKLVDWSGRIVRDSLAPLPSYEIVVLEHSRGSTDWPRAFGRSAFFALGADRLIYFGWNEDVSLSR